MSYIYTEVTKGDFHDAFRRMDRLENFSYEGRNTLYDVLTEYAEHSGPIELDVIALCCEWCETSEDEAREAYEIDKDQSVYDYLDENTIVYAIGGDRWLFAQF